MKFKTIPLTIAALLSFAAHATDNTPRPPSTPVPKPTPTNFITTTTTADAVSGSNATNFNIDNKQTSAQGGRASANAQGGDASNSLSLKFDAQLRNPVATASAPALAASTGACMGSSSAGAQGVALGISVGTTWTDDNCDRRYDSIRMQELGFNNAAVQLMCDKPSVREAMRKTGTPCIGDEPYKPGEPTSVGSCEAYKGNDPVVRARVCK